MNIDDLNKEIELSIRDSLDRFTKSRDQITGIPKPFVVEVSHTVTDPERFRNGNLGGADAEVDAYDKATEGPPFGPPGDGGGDDDERPCVCESVSLLAQGSTCDDDITKKYCAKGLRYTYSGDGPTPDDYDFTDRTALDLGTDDVEGFDCDSGSPGDWFYDPSSGDLADWLASMVAPPDTALAGSYEVSFYFECYRKGHFEPGGLSGGESHFVPCGDDTSSEIQLIGICYH